MDLADEILREKGDDLKAVLPELLSQIVAEKSPDQRIVREVGPKRRVQLGGPYTGYDNMSAVVVTFK